MDVPGRSDCGSRSHCAGLVPQANAWAATLASLLGYLAFHGLVMAVLAAHLVARIVTGRVVPAARGTYEHVAQAWAGSCAVGVVVAVLPHVTAWFMR